MMNGFSGGFGWMWIIPMTVMMIAFIGVVIWGMNRFMHSDYRMGHHVGCGGYADSLPSGKESAMYQNGEDAKEILVRRFAEGKIDYDEFQSRLDVIMKHDSTDH